MVPAHAASVDAFGVLIKRSVVPKPVDHCASCSMRVTEGDHDRAVPSDLSQLCPICGSAVTKMCERLNGSRVVRCSGGHVLEASFLAMF